ncbi:MAG: DUF4256 domain-containing protein [Candidatus Altimarinota bacterium]
MHIVGEFNLNFMDNFKSRFLAHPHRHPNITWEEVEKGLLANPDTLAIIERMEESGGEPDVVELTDGEDIYFVDCSTESPVGRRSLCYDEAALIARKENKPKSSVEQMAKEIGINLLNEEQYRKLQSIDNFDTKTSTWIDTPKEIRSKGGALYGDRRYDRVFTYHNGADSYYAARGFRGFIKI